MKLPNVLGHVIQLSIGLVVFLILSVTGCGKGGWSLDPIYGPPPPPPPPCTSTPATISALAPALPPSPHPSLAVFAGNMVSNYTDGVGAAARFYGPSGIATDSSGNVYVADSGNKIIRKITPAGAVSTLAGTAGTFGSADGIGAAASFSGPSGIATDSSGNLYVTDVVNNTIRKITPSGVVTTPAGKVDTFGSADGIGGLARFNNPAGIATDVSGNVYVADTWNNTIRKITPVGAVTTLAGMAGVSGSADGTGGASSFSNPTGIAMDVSGNVYVADTWNDTIRKITPVGAVTTLAGTAGVKGSTDGTGVAASFNNPTRVATDTTGNLYVADSGNNTIRKITPAGMVTTLAGTAGVKGSADGTGAAAQFYGPSGIATDALGNVYVADGGNNTIRKITPSGVVTTLAGTAVMPGSADGTGAAAQFYGPSGIATDTAGNVYVADTRNNTIRKITTASVVTTLAGTAGMQGGSADGIGAAARFKNPTGIATDTGGNVYVADTNNHTIRKITPTGEVTTLAGTAGMQGSADGIGAAARFSGPRGIATDVSGNVYVADGGNNTIRKITSTGHVTTLAGTAGVQGCVDGNGTAARFNYPSAIATDSAGNVFVTDTTNNGLFGIVRKITPSGEVATFVAGDAFLNLYGIATDVAGNVYVADTNGHVIQKISPSAVVSTIVGTGSAGFEPGTLPGSITYPLGVASWGNTLFITMDHGVAVADLP